MRRIRVTANADKDSLLAVMLDHERVNKGVRFEEGKGKPKLHIRENNGRLRIKCELIGGATKDNGFLEGTVFFGRIRSTADTTTISGIAITAPIYHLFLLILFAFYIYRCITLSGFNPVPVLLLAFSLFLFRTEFKKQGMIERYIARASRIAGGGSH